MAAWRDVERAQQEFARCVRELFDGHRHRTMATVRAGGSPRISGIEALFEDGELVFGSMANARKDADLRRDPRFALHCATIDPVEGAEARWPGEAKIAGRAILIRPLTRAPTVIGSAPISPRSYIPISTKRPGCSSSRGGPLRKGSVGTGASSPPGEAGGLKRSG